MSSSDHDSYVTAKDDVGDATSGATLSSREGSFFSLTSGNSVYFTAPSSSQEPSLKDEVISGQSENDQEKERLVRSNSQAKKQSEGNAGPSGEDVHRASTSSSPLRNIVPSAAVAAGSKKIKAQSSTDSTVSTADSSSTTLADFPSDYEDDEDDGTGCKDGEGYDPDKDADAECYAYFRSQHYPEQLDPIIVDESRLFRTFTSDNIHSPSTSSSSNNSNSHELNSADGVALQIKADVSRICNEIAITSKPNLSKENQIQEALLIEDNFDKMRRLRELSIEEDGLLTNTIRKRVWPVLLGVPQPDLDRAKRNHYHLPKLYNNVSNEIQNLVHLDVSRVLKRFPPGLSDPQQDHLLAYLTKLICSTLEKNPKVYYYQGFHDISITFLLVSISQTSTPYIAYLCLNKMIQCNLGPFMEITMESVHNLIHVVFSLLEQENKQLYQKIVVDSKCPVAFCLPWVLTWFSHTLPNDNDIFRLYDFILGCTSETHPSCLIPIFISASLVLRSESRILQSTINDSELAIMHHTLSLLPSEQETLEPWLHDSLFLMRKYKGRETQLMKRAKEIKDYQNQLWNQDSPEHDRRKRVRRTARNGGNPNESIIMRIGRFIFIKHKWYTIALIVLGTAYLIQTKYGLMNDYNIKYRKIFPNLKSLVQTYLISPAVSWFETIKKQIEFEGFFNSNTTRN